MITIIEGTDGVGKTTFAEYLAEQTGAKLMHASAPTTGDWFSEYIVPVANAYNDGIDLVLDRWHIGEMVWSKVFGRDPLMTARQFAACNKILDVLGAQVLYIDRPASGIMSTVLLQRQEGEDALMAALTGHALYKDVIEEAKKNIRVWETDFEQVTSRRDTLVSILENQRSGLQ